MPTNDPIVPPTRLDPGTANRKTASGEKFPIPPLTQVQRLFNTRKSLGKVAPFGATTCRTKHFDQMLGHEDLRTTQIYTRVSIRKLKQVHDATHAGARLERTARQPLSGGS